MRKIPTKLRKEMQKDPFYKQCCISTATKNIEWHHNLIYGGKQVNEKFAILPLADFIHRKIDFYKEKCDWIMWNRATDEEIKRYSKAIDYKKVKERLNEKYHA